VVFLFFLLFFACNKLVKKRFNAQLHGMTLHDAARRCMTLHDAARRCTTLHDTAQRCIPRAASWDLKICLASSFF
jgi:hypothetical protein